MNPGVVIVVVESLLLFVVACLPWGHSEAAIELHFVGLLEHVSSTCLESLDNALVLHSEFVLVQF
jgi:hypothetical protein